MRSVIAALALVVVGLATAPPSVAAPPPTLQLGSSGAAVRDLQRTLVRGTYLPRAAVDGRFGLRTWHAVVAFQGWSRIGRDGIVGARTRGALRGLRRPVPWSSRTGYEVHIGEQVLLMVRAGRVVRAMHVSSGAGGATPVGHFRILRRERMSWSRRFHVWIPFAQYFSGGYAMHAYPSVPAYPASHGCVRLPTEEASTVWSFGRLRMRMWISSAGHRTVGRRSVGAGCPSAPSPAVR